MPSHYLNQCWNIVKWTLRNKLQWNFNRNSNIFIQENPLQNVICEMASILSRPQCVKWRRPVGAVNKPTIDSDNGLSSDWHQAIIWTNDDLLLSKSLQTNFSEIWLKIRQFSFKQMNLKMLSATCFVSIYLRLHVLTHWGPVTHICVGNLGHYWFR